MAGGRAVGAAQQIGETLNLLAYGTIETLRRAAHVRKVYEIAIDIRVADRADRIAALVVIDELSERSVEQYRLEYTGDGFVHLPPLHR